MMRYAREAARWFDNAEIVELHHEKKYDAPSGTAMRTAELIGAVREDVSLSDEGRLELVEGARGGVHHGVRIHSIRLPGHVAHQEIIFGSAGETLRIRHDLVDRRSFMPGVLLAVRRVGDLTGVYGLEQLLFPGDEALSLRGLGARLLVPAHILQPYTGTETDARRCAAGTGVAALVEGLQLTVLGGDRRELELVRVLAAEGARVRVVACR